MNIKSLRLALEQAATRSTPPGRAPASVFETGSTRARQERRQRATRPQVSTTRERRASGIKSFEDFRLWSMLHDAHRRAGGPDVRRASGAVAPSWSAEHGRALMSPPVVTVSPRASRRLQHVRRARARCATDGRALGAPGGCGDLISGPPRFMSGMRSAARREVSHHHLPLQPGVFDQLRLQSDETRRRKSKVLLRLECIEGVCGVRWRDLGTLCPSARGEPEPSLPHRQRTGRLNKANHS
jgi:hypothetical protein